MTLHGALLSFVQGVELFSTVEDVLIDDLHISPDIPIRPLQPQLHDIFGQQLLPGPPVFRILHLGVSVEHVHGAPRKVAIVNSRFADLIHETQNSATLERANCMPRDFLHNHPEFADLIRIVAEEKGIDPTLVEKDYWIMHCLYGLQQQGFTFQLKGARPFPRDITSSAGFQRTSIFLSSLRPAGM
jgi:hypothetical protein